MANRIKVTVVNVAHDIRNHDYGQSAVDQVINSWRMTLNGVMYERPDLIVLPECCDRCWDASVTMEKLHSYYETRGEQLLDAFADFAAKNRCYITCPAWRKAEDGTWRNAIQLIDRKGGIAGVYDKNFPVIGEMKWGVQPGDRADLIECDFGTVACAICFDLNFDELREHYAKLKPDLLLFASVYHGGMMQAYWAYSIRAHFAGAITRLPSEILNPLGMQLATTTNYMLTATKQINLDCAVMHLDENWGKFNDIKSKYGSDVSIVEPGLLAPVVLSSESDAFTAADIVREFKLELLDDYFDRSRAFRADRLAAAATAFTP